MKVLFLGHSLVEYYDWRERFPVHEVHNYGIAGETVGGLLARVDGVAQAHPAADLVLVMTGTNDVLMGDRSYVAVYRLLMEKLKGRWPSARIVAFSVLPAHPEWIEVAAIAGINEELGGIVGEAGAEFSDLTRRFLDEAGHVRLELLLEDGVHLSGEGYRVWSKAVEELLEETGSPAPPATPAG